MLIELFIAVRVPMLFSFVCQFSWGSHATSASTAPTPAADHSKSVGPHLAGSAQSPAQPTLESASEPAPSTPVAPTLEPISVPPAPTLAQVTHSDTLASDLRRCIDVCQLAHPNTGPCNDACVSCSTAAEAECKRNGHASCADSCLTDMGRFGEFACPPTVNTNTNKGIPSGSATVVAATARRASSAPRKTRSSQRRRIQKAHDANSTLAYNNTGLPQCFANLGFPWMPNGATAKLMGEWVKMGSMVAAYGEEVASKCTRPPDHVMSTMPNKKQFLREYEDLINAIWRTPPCHTDVKRRPIRFHPAMELFQPYSCKLQQVSSSEFVKNVTGRTLVFIGDSMMHQFYVTVMCQLVRFAIGYSEGAGWKAFKLDSGARIVFEASNELSHGKAEEATRYLNNLRETGSLTTVGGIRLRRRDVMLLNGAMLKHLGSSNLTEAAQPYYELACEVHNCSKSGGNCPAFLWRQTSANHFAGDGTGRWRTAGGRAPTTKQKVDTSKLKCIPVNTVENPDRILEANRISRCGVRMLPSIDAENTKGFETRFKRKEVGSPAADCLHYCLPGVPNHWTRLFFNAIVHSGIMA